MASRIKVLSEKLQDQASESLSLVSKSKSLTDELSGTLQRYRSVESMDHPLLMAARSKFDGSEITKREELRGSKLTVFSLFTHSKTYEPTPPAPVLDQNQVDQFVQHVAYGEQDEAEAMLQREPKLALGKGDCKDHAGREFKGITGFQYALWAVDWHMWEMIRVYLDKVDPQSAAIQCQTQESLTSDQGHGTHFSFEPLMAAYQTYLDRYDALCQARIGMSWTDYGSMV